MTTVREVMTPAPTVMPPSATLRDAAMQMAISDIGDVLVGEDGGALQGIVTDRDLVIRGLTIGADPDTIRLEEVCTTNPCTTTPDADVRDALRIMRTEAIRRMPVVEDNQPVGILSLGDLAIEFDHDSLLAAISRAPSDD